LQDTLQAEVADSGAKHIIRLQQLGADAAKKGIPHMQLLQVVFPVACDMRTRGLSCMRGATILARANKPTQQGDACFATLPASNELQRGTLLVAVCPLDGVQQHPASTTTSIMLQHASIVHSPLPYLGLAGRCCVTFRLAILYALLTHQR
jgi:hypothetical protein